MAEQTIIEFTRNFLAEASIEAVEITERTFPGEHWLVVYVQEDSLIAAQSLSGSLEETLSRTTKSDDSFAVVFRSRPRVDLHDENAPARDRGRLAGADIARLVQLLEARSRTSDALPSLNYVEDPRASLSAIAASRHQLIFGRRGVGKTALMLEAKQSAEKSGNIAVWINAHVVRDLAASDAFVFIAKLIIRSVVDHGGTSTSKPFERLASIREKFEFRTQGANVQNDDITSLLPDLNQGLRGVLRSGVLRLFVFIDDLYLMPMDQQPKLLDTLAAILRDCDAWLKLASIERLTRPYEPSTRTGLEVPHDASKIDLDVTLEDPSASQRFLESVLANYTSTVGLRGVTSIAKPEALGRLVLASGGVPRDYLNLFASSIVVARQSRTQAREIGREDVAKAAGIAARGKKKDLDQDVSSSRSGQLISALEKLSNAVKSVGFTFFRVDIREKGSDGYDLLGQLMDLRFVHLIQAAVSDQHKSGIKYEAFLLDLSEYSDVRLKRKLEILDLENGQWVHRLTGKGRSKKALNGTEFRDRLRDSPLIKMEELAV